MNDVRSNRNIEYKYNNDNVSFNEVRSLLIKAFGGRTIDSIDDVRKAFLNSSHVIYAYDKNKLIGFARAISDIEWSIIYNVVVDPDYQSLGIGKEILNRLVLSLENRHIFAYTHPRTISFYEHLGFKRSKMAFKYVFEDEKEKVNQMEHLGFFLPNGYQFENEIKEIKKEIEEKRDLSIEYRNTLSEIDYIELNQLLENAFKHERNLDLTKKEFEGSTYVSFAYIDGKLVGCARLITDGVREAILLNVAVKDEYQGYGIARNIIRNLANQAKGYDIFIHANPKSYSFYNTHSEFKRYKTAFAYISISEPDSSDFFLPNGYRHIDEYYNLDIKYYKGKILN